MIKCNVLQVGAATPAPTSEKPSWLQKALSNFVMLRKTAAWLEGKNELLCMPVVVTASPRASASSLAGTASAKSCVKDIYLRPVTDTQMHTVVLGLAKWSKKLSHHTCATATTAGAASAVAWWQSMLAMPDPVPLGRQLSAAKQRVSCRPAVTQHGSIWGKSVCALGPCVACGNNIAWMC